MLEKKESYADEDEDEEKKESIMEEILIIKKIRFEDKLPRCYKAKKDITTR